MNFNDWIEYKLQDICLFKTGKLNSNAAVENGKYPFFTCSPETYRINDYSFDQEAILLAGNNANGVFNIKHYTGKFDAYQRTYIINSKDESIVTNKYLYYSLGLQLNNLKQLSIGSATKFLTKIILDNLVIKIPSYRPNMDKITKILTELDDKIQTNNKINENLQSLTQLLFKHWFVDFEFPNEKGLPYKSSGGEMVDSVLGMIPKGWKVGSLEDIIEFNPKESLKKDNKYKFVEMAALGNNTSSIEYWEKREAGSGSKFRNGDTLLARITPCLENGKTAYVDILEENEVAFGSTEFIVMRETDISNRIYIYCLARDNNFRAHAIKSMVGSSGRQRVQLDLLKNYKVPQAPKYIYQNFGKVTGSFFDMISNNSGENDSLKKLRDTLLPKLMSGEIDLSNLQID